MSYKSIAIDGPSGAGKSTLAKMASSYYGFIYLDTGAIYRCVGLYALKNGVSSKDEEGVKALLSSIDINISHDAEGVQHMFLNGDDVSDEIRLPEVSIYASDVSAMKSVRAFLLDMQRSVARSSNVIMDGRDIGTVVLPDADVKIYLFATPEVRADRRYKELREKGQDVTYDEVFRDLQYRDNNDSNRAEAPLRPADDAVMADTTTLNLEESFELIKKIIEDKIGK